MDFPTGYQTSLNFRVTGTVPPQQLDKTGRFIDQDAPGSPFSSVARLPQIPGAEQQLEQAEAAQQQKAAAGEQSGGTGKDKKQFCIDLLIAGCVRSFVDFLKITHKDQDGEDGAEDTTDEPTVALPGETLTLEDVKNQDIKKVAKTTVDIVYLKETLEKAENARRAKNYNLCVDAYENLARYFEGLSDLNSGKYFYHRCVEVAQEAGSQDTVAKANLNLGMCEEKLKNWQLAMQYHETALELSTESNAVVIQSKTAFQLCKVYRQLAETLLENQTKSNIVAAADLFEKCVACSKLAKDITLEGQNCYRLGKVKILSKEYDEAIRLQTQYLEICNAQNDQSGESAARAALAQAYEASGNVEEAIKQLEILLTVAAEAGELEAQAQACLNLGLLYSDYTGAAGQDSDAYEKSIRLLERHFDLARQLGDRELVDAARVILGMARGNGKLDLYMSIVRNNLSKLLDWKSRRVPLEPNTN